MRVVFPLRGPGKPSGRKSPKNGEKLQNSPPRSGPRKWGKITTNYENCIFGVSLPLFWGNFRHLRGSERGGEFCNFSPFFGDFRPGGFQGPLMGKNNSQSQMRNVLAIEGQECKWTLPFSDWRRAPKSLSSAQAAPPLRGRH